ncbi:efflux RND transporter periplasmic adaptor subunit [Synechococcus sp. PCC 7336]|uniref:efflux RND transporter periplasmic adaptor subunit n=1 Tax=Synechococcus sp. PCC 7336 TaxID=195250 RepID=UPI000363045C|nr:efflux RND transporter periplasmic adaptor subunit [Synechococcus sp. PCC 7336]
MIGTKGNAHSSQPTLFPGQFGRALMPIAALVVLAACGGGGSGPQADRAVPVDIEPVREALVRDSTVYLANIVSEEFATISPRVSGNLSAVYVRLGDEVSARDPLMQIDAGVSRAELDAARSTVVAREQAMRRQEAALERALAQQRSAEAEVELRQVEFERNTFLQTEGVVSQQALDEASRNIRQAEADVAAQVEAVRESQVAIAEMRAQAEEAEASAQASASQLEFFTIRAPFSGTIGEVPVKVGDFVQTSTVLTTLTQDRALEVEIRIPLERAPQIASGLPVDFLSETDETIGTSEISFIDPRVDNETQSILVKAIYENLDGRLRNSQFVRARVIWSESPGLLVPTSAISRIGGQSFVFVASPAGVESGEAEPVENADEVIAVQTPIQLGAIQGQSYHVKDGLNPGDRIVTSGILKLRNNTPITQLSEAEAENSAEAAS